MNKNNAGSDLWQCFLGYKSNSLHCSFILLFLSFVIMFVSGDPFEGERTRHLSNILLFWYNSLKKVGERGPPYPSQPNPESSIKSIRSAPVLYFHEAQQHSSKAIQIELAAWWNSLVSNLRYLNIAGWPHPPLLPFVSLGGQRRRRGTKSNGWSIYLSIRRNSSSGAL